MAILKGLCAVAWADGRVAAEEREVIDALLEAFGASRSQAAEIRAYAATEKRLTDVPVAELSYDDRRLLLQHAVLLTFIDGEQAESELKMLESLCEVLSIPGAEASGLLSAASERAKKLLNLLD